LNYITERLRCDREGIPEDHAIARARCDADRTRVALAQAAALVLFIVPGFSGTGAFARHLFLRGRWREPTRAKRIDDSFEQEAITNQAIGMTIIATPRMSKRLGLAADPAPRFSRC
jgi:hypothetical protein